ncbi:MAG: hypothetical protein ACI9JY_002156 [Saprospiraceae bacterium]
MEYYDKTVISTSVRETKTIGIPVTLFLGLKFFVVPQFSISIESDATEIYQSQKVEIRNFESSMATAKRPKISATNMYMTFMRYLSLNYHF